MYLNVVIILDIPGLSWPLGCVHYRIDTSPPHPFPFRSAPAGRSPWRPPLQLRKPLDDGQHVPGPWSLEHGPMASARLDMITNALCSGHKEVILMDLTPSTKHHTTLLQYIDEIWWDHWCFFFFRKKNIDVHCMLSLYLRIFVPKTSDRSFREAWPSAHKLCHTKGSLCRCCVPGVSRWVQMSTVDVPYGSIWDILQRSSKTHMLSNVQVCVAVLSPAHTVNALRPNGKWHLHIWSESVTASWNDRRLLPKLVWQM